MKESNQKKQLEGQPKAAGEEGLILEVSDKVAEDSFDRELGQALSETEQAVTQIGSASIDLVKGRSWGSAREIIESFKPVPWFVWRLNNYVLGKTSQIAPVSEGLVLGLRRLLFAAASDEVLGSGKKTSNLREALRVIKPDVVAALSVIHAVCRRLANTHLERVWKPIVDDAVLRARIGLFVGRKQPEFGSGRAMLAGFVGRAGLAILIAKGDESQAQSALEKLASGSTIKNVGLEVYGCDPLQVSAMLLSAAGCGRDASFGTVSYASSDPLAVVANDEQLRWLSAFSLCEGVRMNSADKLDFRYWQALNLEPGADLKELSEEARKAVRRGHGWSWLL